MTSPLYGCSFRFDLTTGKIVFAPGDSGGLNDGLIQISRRWHPESRRRSSCLESGCCPAAAYRQLETQPLPARSETAVLAAADTAW